MSFLDNLFDSSNSLPTGKTASMLDTDLFWQIIENSLHDADTLEQQECNLINELSFLTAEDIIGFRLRTEFLMYQSYNSDLWCAATIMNDGSSDGGFHNFRYWLISQGKQIFTDAMLDSDNLANYFVDGFNEEDLYEFEAFGNIPNEAFTRTYEQSIHNFIDFENFQYFEKNYPALDFNWDEDNMITMQLICPNLFTIFIENATEYEDDDDDDEDRSDEFDID